MLGPWDEQEYDREMRAMYKGIKANFKRLDRENKRVLHELMIPAWLKIGEALVRDGKYKAWERFVKSEGKARKDFGYLIQETVDVMLALETEGIEKAMEVFRYLEVSHVDAMKAITLFSRQGIDFANAVRETHPEWDVSKKLAKFEGHTDPKVTQKEIETATLKATEVLEYIDKLQELPNNAKSASLLEKYKKKFTKIEAMYKDNVSDNINSVKR